MKYSKKMKDEGDDRQKIRELTLAIMEKGVTGIAYETVERPDWNLPILTPMSEVSGRMSIQIGAQYLEKTHGGRGKLLGGVPGVRPADVTIIGAGVVGTNAAQMALGMGAHVVILDIDTERLRYLEQMPSGRFTTLSSNPLNIAEAVKRADLVIGSCFSDPGLRAVFGFKSVQTPEPFSIMEEDIFIGNFNPNRIP